jgi:hypothetical protein
MNEPTTKPKKRGCGKLIAIGCGVLLVLAIIGGIAAFFGGKSIISRLVDNYTDTTPLQLPAIDAAQEEVDSLLTRADDFSEAIQHNGPIPELLLSARDINILIQNYPDWNDFAGQVFVTINDDKIQGQVSIPLDQVGADMFKGRYLNGSAVFRLDMNAGRLLLFADSIEVRGKPIPEEFMKTFRTRNLAEKANEKPEVIAFIEKLSSIKVQGGYLHIVPKSTSAQ